MSEQLLVKDESINGVPVQAVEGLIGAIRDDADKGQTKWQASTTWKGGFQCESTIRDHVVHMDEPEGLGGSNTAPNMVEMVLAAYSSCLTVGYTMNAALRGIEIKDLKIEVEGDIDLAGFLGIDDNVPAGFSDIKTTVHLDSDASPEQLQALHDQVLRTSPVGSILTRALNVSTDLA